MAVMAYQKRDARLDGRAKRRRWQRRRDEQKKEKKKKKNEKKTKKPGKARSASTRASKLSPAYPQDYIGCCPLLRRREESCRRVGLPAYKTGPETGIKRDAEEEQNQTRLAAVAIHRSLLNLPAGGDVAGRDATTTAAATATAHGVVNSMPAARSAGAQ
ncbi:uncharacterized protein ARB_07008 [Trichophyton benhamiae CBS 112371]|uniref:Uncharacterized protein n=1 Tax=Arthroderma benhamiae (strain ATCC MYA-4681 / CBS 112371) TaxID=663331 RepID=D4ARZ3_ARTBC|nr:uncharacterized protein ARB_07008 [Trichophyton benhamiae CBS 112371]EFE34057.1 hypothetical protein ARB_07008 [Trichophyton benhamiae CBS 112371]